MVTPIANGREEANDFGSAMVRMESCTTQKETELKSSLHKVDSERFASPMMRQGSFPGFNLFANIEPQTSPVCGSI